MRREIKGVDALANAFPPQWLLYVSLNCFPRGQDPMEIDVMVVMDDRVLILEIKDWNGNLTHSNDRWYIGNQCRGRSPVIQSNEKAKKLKTVLKSEFGSVGKNLWVDSRVVLTGSATKHNLHSSETPYVWTLSEACSIPDPQKRKALLNSVKLGLLKLHNFESDFERVVGNTKIFQPLDADWAGYQVVEPDVFVHPRGVWSDHRAERRGESRLKAMVRTWSFDKLPVGLNSSERRQLVALRETKAFAYLQENDSELIKRNRILREIAAPSEEIVTHHFEVREIVQGWNTLDRYLERARDDLSLDDRLVIVSGVLNLVSQLHRCSVSHRDLGPRCVWIGSPSDIALTGFMSCQLPDQESVLDWLTALRGYAPDLPEDRTPTVPSTGRLRDVYMCAYLVALVLSGRRPDKGVDAAASDLPAELSHLADWLKKGLAPDPALRFVDVVVMAEEFASLVEPKQTIAVDQSMLDRFQTTLIPYQRWIIKAPLPSKPSCTVYVAEDEHGASLTVKVWNGLIRGMSASVDLSLLKLLNSAALLKRSPIKGLPKFIDVGLSPLGPYLVYEHSDGVLLNQLQTLTEVDALRVCLDILTAVDALHDLGCDHGDISGSNVIFDNASSSVLLLDPFDISPIGTGGVCTPALYPPNWERLSQQALDRYAALKLAAELLSKHSSDAAIQVSKLFANELGRPIIESLEPATNSLRKALQQVAAPPTARIALTTPTPLQGFEGGRGFFVKRQPIEGGLERFTLTNLNGQLQVEGNGHHVTSHRPYATRFTTLAHESIFGEHVDIEISLESGNDRGFDELYQYLRKVAGEIPPEVGIQVSSTDGCVFDVERHWRRLMALEEEGRVEIEIAHVLASREGVTICRYENLGKEFDFDPEDTIEVLSSLNKRVGEVDHTLSDFPGTIAIRGDSRRLAVGERLRLADRREQASIDRRTKAIDRILDRRSAIPDLVDYFYPNADIEPTNYAVEIPDDELNAYCLNTGQKEAFRNLLRSGPVGLLQGPPGTGKTRFIASFVHWLLTKGGSERILIASQSHEAVNNAIDSLLLLYKRLGGKPNLLRIGSKGITERIKPYHSAELRERYRVRFEAAAKFRYSQLTSAKGISRAFISDLFDLDQKLGTLSRRCLALQSLTALDSESLSVDRERSQAQLARVESAFQAAGKQLLGRDIDPKRPADELERAIRDLASNHSDVSPADVTAAERILVLTRDWLSSLASPQRNFEEFLAKTRSVVTATCVGVGQTRIRIDSQIFDWVIVDEAARCTPGELAVPIQMARRILLVGDHLQLMPMLSRELVDQLEEEAPTSGRGQLEISDFERAFISPYGNRIGVRFTEQYRMDPVICKMVSKCFYEPKSVTLRTSADRYPTLMPSPSSARWLSKPLVWIDTSSQSNEGEVRPLGSTTRYNDTEVEAVILLLETIASDTDLVNQLANGDDETPIGVICMYSGQKKRIELACARHAWDPRFRRLVRIDTVDSYQGKENAIVILSLVCSNLNRDVGHVGSPNRCNVAVSRAKDRLAIVGSTRMWKSVPTTYPMAAVLSYMETDSAGSLILDMGELR
ncbi:MAG: AAA domain-containing protein [Methylomicrobium sp.]